MILYLFLQFLCMIFGKHFARIYGIFFSSTNPAPVCPPWFMPNLYINLNKHARESRGSSSSSVWAPPRRLEWDSPTTVLHGTRARRELAHTHLSTRKSKRMRTGCRHRVCCVSVARVSFLSKKCRHYIVRVCIVFSRR